MLDAMDQLNSDIQPPLLDAICTVPSPLQIYRLLFECD